MPQNKIVVKAALTGSLFICDNPFLKADVILKIENISFYITNDEWNGNTSWFFRLIIIITIPKINPQKFR